MEDSHVIAVYLWKFNNAEDHNNWSKWSIGSLIPLLMSTDSIIGIDSYRFIDGQHPHNILAFNHYLNLSGYLIDTHSPERDAYRKDIQTTWGGKFEWSWLTLYQLVKRLKSPDGTQIKDGELVNTTTRFKDYANEDGPMMLLRGLRLSSDEWQRYDNWIYEWGYNIYVPLLLKVPGTIEYSRWWLSNITPPGIPPKPGVSENPEHPQDLSLIYFENLKAYENFLKSKELAVFDQNLKNAFPEGLTYTWNFDARLTRRWSK
jgi:hypothetical protein